MKTGTSSLGAGYRRLGYKTMKWHPVAYDRFIESAKYRKKIITIGLAFDFQKFYKLPISKHDQKLDYIITNKNILK